MFGESFFVKLTEFLFFDIDWSSCSMASSIISAVSSSGEPSSPNFSDTASFSASNNE